MPSLTDLIFFSQELTVSWHFWTKLSICFSFDFYLCCSCSLKASSLFMCFSCSIVRSFDFPYSALSFESSLVTSFVVYFIFIASEFNFWLLYSLTCNCFVNLLTVSKLSSKFGVNSASFRPKYSFSPLNFWTTV